MNPLLKEAERQGLSRREFLQNLLFTAGSVSAASWLTACGGGSPAATTTNSVQTVAAGGAPSFRSQFADIGPLLPADANGIQLPAGFTSQELAVFNEVVLPGSNDQFVWHSEPDGGGTFRMPDGGWIYVSNSERRDSTTLGSTRDQAVLLDPTVLMGGVSALRFDANGALIDAYPCQRGSTTNCSGGATPWGTWINGEEIVDGYMFECSPLRDGGDAVRLDEFGRKGHEMVAVDPVGQAIYHTEDAGGDDRFYRNIYPDAAWPGGTQRPDHSQSTLQVLSIPAGLNAARNGPTAIVWLDANNAGDPKPAQQDVRLAESTLLEGNEGVWYLNGFIFLTTKSDDNIWAIDTFADTIESIYKPEDGIIGSPVDPAEPPMAGVDNIAMTLDGEMLVVEDGGDMRCMVLLPDRTTIPLLRLPGEARQTEVTGVAIAPSGRHIYVSGQRSLRNGFSTDAPAPGTYGITYQITMPFAVRVDRPLAGTLPGAG